MTNFFYKGLTRNPEIPLSKFCPKSRHWGKSGVLKLAQMSLINSFSMLQNVWVTPFTVSGLLSENKQRGVD